MNFRLMESLDAYEDPNCAKKLSGSSSELDLNFMFIQGNDCNELNMTVISCLQRLQQSHDIYIVDPNGDVNFHHLLFDKKSIIFVPNLNMNMDELGRYLDKVKGTSIKFIITSKYAVHSKKVHEDFKARGLSHMLVSDANISRFKRMTRFKNTHFIGKERINVVF